MQTFLYDPAQVDDGTRRALELIAEDFPVRPIEAGEAANVLLYLSTTGPRFEVVGDHVRLWGGSVPMLLRALAALRGFAHSGTVPELYEQRANFDTLGLMWDQSRNAVATPATARYLLRRMALMGMNLLMLYTEDTFETPGEPYLGHLRGRWTQQELRELDDYAHTLGIELVPCIELLGHMDQPLRWWKRYGEVRDTPGVLLADEPKTYELIEKLINAVSSCCRSKRIHIGMDETHGLATGAYRQRFGDRHPADVFCRHLRRICEITDRLGLKPMMWSDMFFCLGSKTGSYYDLDANVPAWVRRQIPDSVQLVYWDYYHYDDAFYAAMMDKHVELTGEQPMFAPGMWTDNFWFQNYWRAKVCTDAGMTAARQRGVREALATAWGDDGQACDTLSMLPGLQNFAEHGYGDAVDQQRLARMFRGSTGADIEAYTSGRLNDDTLSLGATPRQWAEQLGQPLPDFVKPIADEPGANIFSSNPANYLLWQDPMLGIFEHHLQGLALASEYRKIAKAIEKAQKAGAVELHRLALPLALARLLEVKASLGVDLITAYRKRNRNKLTALRDKTIPKAIKRAKKAHKAHRSVWFELYRPQGWEVQDVRWAGLVERLRSTAKRIDEYLKGKVERLPELEEDRLVVSDFPPGCVGYGGPRYRSLISPSVIT